mmetsp:Transcript_19998/g.46697  ORF Transcript_19998/g.46697 Transcript_19998/m.46697 type:complete len:729 (-) Transcript_19998:369-2555(-)
MSWTWSGTPICCHRRFVRAPPRTGTTCNSAVLTGSRPGCALSGIPSKWTTPADGNLATTVDGTRLTSADALVSSRASSKLAPRLTHSLQAASSSAETSDMLACRRALSVARNWTSVSTSWTCKRTSSGSGTLNSRSCCRRRFSAFARACCLETGSAALAAGSSNSVWGGCDAQWTRKPTVADASLTAWSRTRRAMTAGTNLVIVSRSRARSRRRANTSGATAATISDDMATAAAPTAAVSMSLPDTAGCACTVLSTARASRTACSESATARVLEHSLLQRESHPGAWTHSAPRCASGSTRELTSQPSDVLRASPRPLLSSSVSTAISSSSSADTVAVVAPFRDSADCTDAACVRAAAKQAVRSPVSGRHPNKARTNDAASGLPEMNGARCFISASARGLMSAPPASGASMPRSSCSMAGARPARESPCAMDEADTAASSNLESHTLSETPCTRRARVARSARRGSKTSRPMCLRRTGPDTASRNSETSRSTPNSSAAAALSTSSSFMITSGSKSSTTAVEPWARTLVRSWCQSPRKRGTNSLEAKRACAALKPAVAIHASSSATESATAASWCSPPLSNSSERSKTAPKTRKSEDTAGNPCLTASLATNPGRPSSSHSHCVHSVNASNASRTPGWWLRHSLRLLLWVCKSSPSAVAIEAGRASPLPRTETIMARSEGAITLCTAACGSPLAIANRACITATKRSETWAGTSSSSPARWAATPPRTGAR